MMPTLATIAGGASTLYSSIIIGIGVGSVTGILALSTIRSSTAQGTAFMVAGVGSGLSMVLLGFATTPLAVILAAGVTGATQATYMALTTTIIQQTVSDEMRGRVLSLYLSLATAHMAFLNFGFGWAADGIRVRILLIAPGLLWTASSLSHSLASTRSARSAAAAPLPRRRPSLEVLLDHATRSKASTASSWRSRAWSAQPRPADGFMSRGPEARSARNLRPGQTRRSWA